jgi:2-oxoglutarate dehydrogenase E2 component (dihydrolipoamide succinyltransferase)
MATVVKMPQLGESVVEGTIERWLKAPGDPVERLEPLLEIATDKIDTEVPAPATGVLLAVTAQEGETVEAGTILAYIGAPGEVVPEGAPADAPAADNPGADQASGATSEPAPDAAPAAEEPAEAAVPGGRAFVSPVVARIAAENDVDLRQVKGTGLGDRVTKKDILAYIKQRNAAPPPAPPPTPVPVTPLAAPPPPPVPVKPGADEELHPLSTMRRLIAEHMVRSRHTSPHATTIMEADMTAVVRHRAAHKAAMAAHGVKLTFMPYFVQATIAGLRAVPEANSRFTDEGIVISRRIHMGMAAAVDKGLIVPVIHNADELNLQGLARVINDLTERARTGKLHPDELQGGTFTLTNHGSSGSLIGAAIINQPQAGILGLGAIVKRPVVRSSSPSLLPDADDAIVIRPMCYLSFTFDHRILDGAGADKFLGIVKSTLENWPNE